MPDHESARRQLEAAQETMRKVSMVPEKDNFPVGTVLRWGSRVAIKKSDFPHPNAENWFMTMYARPLGWSYLVTHISGEIKDAGLRKTSGWEDITVRSDPPIEINTRRPEDYILHDTREDIRWRREGDQWIRMDQNE